MSLVSSSGHHSARGKKPLTCVRVDLPSNFFESAAMVIVPNHANDSSRNDIPKSRFAEIRLYQGMGDGVEPRYEN